MGGRTGRWVTPMVWIHSSHCRWSSKKRSDPILVSKRSLWPQCRAGIVWGQPRCRESYYTSYYSNPCRNDGKLYQTGGHKEMRGGRTLERLVTDWKWERREQELWSLTLPFCLEGSDGKQWRLGKVGHWNETEWMKWWGKSLTEIRVPGGIGPWWTPWRSMDFIQETYVFPGGSALKNPPAEAGGEGSIPGSGRSPREGSGKWLQHSCLGKNSSRDRGAWQATVHAVTNNQTI